MNEWYEAKCPVCGEMVLCAQYDLMGFPQHEVGDDDPMTTVCEKCGTVLHMSWNVTLIDSGNANQTPIHEAQEDTACGRGTSPSRRTVTIEFFITGVGEIDIEASSIKDAIEQFAQVDMKELAGRCQFTTFTESGITIISIDGQECQSDLWAVERELGCDGAPRDVEKTGAEEDRQRECVREPKPEKTRQPDVAEALEKRVELGRWSGMVALWGYSEDHDEEGLALVEENGEETEFYTEQELDRLLCRVGSLGCYYLIYSQSAWKTIPALCGDFARAYEKWGCE